MLEIESHNMFQLWNYIFTFTSLAIMAVFVVDMIGHSTKTITCPAFTWASLVGIIVGETVMTILELYSLPSAIPFACIAAVISSVLIALMLQTKDPEVENPRGRRRSQNIS